jgi:hypothetical protein
MSKYIIRQQTTTNDYLLVDVSKYPEYTETSIPKNFLVNRNISIEGTVDGEFQKLEIPIGKVGTYVFVPSGIRFKFFDNICWNIDQKLKEVFPAKKFKVEKV